MRHRLLTIAIFLLAGAVVNVAVAWVCSAVVTPATKSIRFIAERVDSPAIRDFWLVHEAAGVGVRYVAYTRTDAAGWDRESFELEVEDDLRHHPSWAPWPPDPRPVLYETALFVAAGWPFEGAVVASYSDYDPRWHEPRTVAARSRTWMLLPEARPARVGQWRHAVVLQKQNGPFTARVLPFGLIWPGFAVNTFFYAAILWLAILGPFALRRFIRVGRGLCPKCAYPMGESAVCTECGAELPTKTRSESPFDRASTIG